MSTRPLPDLIGTATAARILDVDRVTVTRWGNAGTLPIAHKMPGESGALLFERSQVTALRELRDKTVPIHCRHGDCQFIGLRADVEAHARVDHPDLVRTDAGAQEDDGR